MFKKIVVVGIAVLMVSGAAFAADKSAKSDKKTQHHLSKMTCEEFIMLDETFKPKVVYYGVAYARGGKPESAVIDVERTEKITPIIIDECKKEPKASFWQKLKAEVKKIF